MSWAGANQIDIEQYRTRGGYRRAVQLSENHEPRLLPTAALICFSHLRWHFVYQRPQHLMGRFAREHRVFFIEEPVASDARSRPLGARDERPLDFRRTDAGIEIDLPDRYPNRDRHPFVLAVTGP